ncbi:DUF1345 domain-containing protein [Caulobacter sp. NIBR1757]|uniref:DUF1345 domain-containing protein n=1 Tax=Caulobacter sp. NIBR1757 TaxID=3016000 RepID=UPI0022F0C877|nr:DUF1345 domain-containing protein [Caulobacter sp. NIBR1757]WGM39670.1 hypothetical protein AMEJIAPC_02595 [Caulobacter sp. NIBR1757]
MDLSGVTRHWRLAVGAAAGVVGWFCATGMGWPGAAPELAGWVVGAVVYLALTWRLFLTADEARVKARAALEDEKTPVLLLVILVAVLASLIGIVMAMIESRTGTGFEKGLVAALAVLTLISSWLMLQTVFVIHYAHRHFGGRKDQVFGFSGDPPTSYMDFVYLSFCIGATFQVSDMTVNTTRLRNLITAHAAAAYFYNTAILALGINIIAGLV